jgi:WD40 repeat protein
MIERKKFIKNYLNGFVSNVLSNLIIEYDYYFSGKCDITLIGHNCDIKDCVVLNNDQIVSISNNNEIKIWNIGQSESSSTLCELTMKASNEFRHYVVELPNILYSSKNSESKRYIPKKQRFTSSLCNCIGIWNMHTKNFEMVLKEYNPYAYVTFYSVLSDGRIIMGTIQGIYKIWNAQTGNCETTMEIHSYSYMTCCELLPDGRLLCGFNDGSLKIWNLHLGKYDMIFDGHSLIIYCCAVLSNDQIVSGSADNRLKIWNVHNKKCEFTFYDNTASVFGIYCCAVLPDGRIVTVSSNDTLKIWNRNSAKAIQNISEKYELVLEGHSKKICCCTVLPDGRIVTGSNDCTLKIWS